MQQTLITTTAGPLCVTHLDSWIPRIEHTATETYIRLVWPYDSWGTKAATVVVSVVKRDVSLEELLEDAAMHLQAEPGVSEVRLAVGRDYAGHEVGRIHYRLAISPEDGAAKEDLLGFAAIRRFDHQATRFDFVAEPKFFEEHYRTTLIMSTTVELVN